MSNNHRFSSTSSSQNLRQGNFPCRSNSSWKAHQVKLSLFWEHCENWESQEAFWALRKTFSFPSHFLPHALDFIVNRNIFIFPSRRVLVFLCLHSDQIHFFLNKNNVTIIPSYESFAIKWSVREDEIGCEICSCDSEMWVQSSDQRQKVQCENDFMKKFRQKKFIILSYCVTWMENDECDFFDIRSWRD